jgi:DNA-binding protein HU-beta
MSDRAPDIIVVAASSRQRSSLTGRARIRRSWSRRSASRADAVSSVPIRLSRKVDLPRQPQMIAAVADRAEMSKADAKRALDALDEIVLEELGDAQKVRLGGVAQLTVRVKPAPKKRRARNPATGEEIDIAAKPASVDVRARPMAKAKAALPSVQQGRRRPAATNGRASR